MVTVAPAPKVTSMTRVALACYVGSAIEYYDFLIYGTAAALVFPAVFFPHLSPAVATIASMGTFAAAFLSRPLGAAVFGHEAVDIDRDLRNHRLVNRGRHRVATMTFGERHDPDRNRDPSLDLRQRRSAARGGRAAEPHQLG